MSDQHDASIGSVLERLARYWAELPALYDEAVVLAGGMGYQRTKGVEYLVRYRQDPATGRKKMSSLGRRCADTDRILEAFLARRGENRRLLAEVEDAIERDCRLARALKFARVPAALAGYARSLDLAAFDGLALAGSAAVYCYEAAWNRRMSGHVMLPGAPMDLVFVVDRRLPDEDIELVLAAIGFVTTAARPGKRPASTHFKSSDGRSAVFIERERYGFGPETDVTATAVSKDGKPAPIRAVSPELWLLIEADHPDPGPVAQARRSFIKENLPQTSLQTLSAATA